MQVHSNDPQVALDGANAAKLLTPVLGPCAAPAPRGAPTCCNSAGVVHTLPGATYRHVTTLHDVLVVEVPNDTPQPTRVVSRHTI